MKKALGVTVILLLLQVQLIPIISATAPAPPPPLQNLTSIVIENGIFVENNILPLFDNTLKNATLDLFIKKMAEVIGYPPQNEGDIVREGYHTRFVQSYLTTMPSISTWFLSKERFQQTRSAYLRVRAFQEDWDKIRDFAVNCRDAVNFAKAIKDRDPEENKKEINGVLVECKSWYIINHLETNRFGERAYKALYEVLDVLITEMYYAFNPMYYLDYDKFKVNVFYQMLNDTTDYHNGVDQAINVDFPDYIAEIRKDKTSTQDPDDLQAKLEEIKRRLTQPPYDTIFKDGDPAVIEERMSDLEFYSWALRGMYDGKVSTGMNKWCPYAQKSLAQKGWIVYRMEWNVNLYQFVNDYNAGIFDEFYDCTEIMFREVYLWVYPSTKSAFDSAGVLVGDGEWDWEKNMKNSAVQHLRLAWDLMGAVLEELKCYMKKTYYFDLREKAIQDTQLDLEKGALFTGISRTIFFPCRIEDDTDLVTQYCTRANHEICAPMVSLDPRQRTDSPYHGGKSLMRPKWVFKYDEHEKKCVGRKDYIMKLYHCRCGFILDCGKDIGENITCQLVQNDLLRGQCRGSVGYPCKTLPLAPGKHDESCASGYCNMKKNSCEDNIVKYHSSYNRGPVDKANELWMVGLLLVGSQIN